MLETLGRYKILGTLGQGAMGVVYKAVDPMIHRTVAIKTVNLSLNHDDLAEYEARFQQEIKAAGGLNHPNIVTIYDVGRTDTLAYMAMEYLQGRELKDIFAAGERPAVADTVDWIAQAALGLGAAHANGVIHRDVKPSNIMIVQQSLAKITDFGIARMNASAVKTMTGMILGSPRYMSPEQVIGRDLDTRTDIFSLGVVLYEALTGIPPFDGDNVNAIMYSTVNSTPAPPSSLNPDVRPMLDLIVAKALAKLVDERYQTMQEFAHDLMEMKRQIGGRARDIFAKDAPSAARPVAIEPLSAGRLEKNAEGSGQVKALGLAKNFDSFEATMKLAAMTRQTSEFSQYISDTHKMRAYTGGVEGVLAGNAAASPKRDAKPASSSGRRSKMKPSTNAVAEVNEWLPKALVGAIVVLAVLAIGLVITLMVR